MYNHRYSSVTDPVKPSPLRSIGKSGFRILQTNTKSENGFHLLEMCPQGGFQLRNPNADFKDFLFTVRWETQNCFRQQRCLFVNYACACNTAVLSVKIRFRISRSIANPKSGFQNLNSDFPIKRTRTGKLEPIHTNPDILSLFHFLYPDLCRRCLTLLWRAVLKICGFGERIHWFRVNRRPIEVKKKTLGFRNIRVL